MKFNCAWVRLCKSIAAAQEEIDPRIKGLGWLETPTDTLLIVPVYSESQIQSATLPTPKHGWLTVRVYCWNTPNGRKDMAADIREMLDALGMPVTTEK
jgi:hypothetical protein